MWNAHFTEWTQKGHHYRRNWADGHHVFLFFSPTADVDAVYVGSTFDISIREIESFYRMFPDTGSIGPLYCTFRYAGTNRDDSYMQGRDKEK